MGCRLYLAAFKLMYFIISIFLNNFNIIIIIWNKVIMLGIFEVISSIASAFLAFNFDIKKLN